MKIADNRGFTLPELVVVIVVFVVLLSVSLFFVRPTSYANSNDDAERRLGIAALAQGVNEYHAKVGAWPAGLPSQATSISNQSGGYDLCKYLVPGYLKDMVFDPQVGTAYTGDASDPQLTVEACNTSGVAYITGYTIQKNTDDTVTLTAPSAVTGVLQIIIR
jgi:prepilin-type N-terminal cleavage/methylation domain-containing protein